MPYRISRGDYAAMYGPTVGDRVRLADTDLVVRVEEDRTVYGEEVKFGGGKVIRDGMGQSQTRREDGAVDTVITNALIIDHWGIVKADVGGSAEAVSESLGQLSTDKVRVSVVHQAAGAITEPPAGLADDPGGLESDFAGLEIEDSLGTDEAVADDLDLSSDFSDDGLATEDEDLVIAAEANGMSTKLDLARAYLDMGDEDGAKQILEEVVAEGSDEQKAEASELLERIG